MFMVGSGSLPIEGGGTHPPVGFSPGFQVTMRNTSITGFYLGFDFGGTALSRGM